MKRGEKKIDLANKKGLGPKELIWFLRNCYLSRRLDDTEITMRKQGQAFFQISGAGHEGILSALAKLLRPSYDFFIPYYRDRALCLGLGVTPYEMLCQANGNTGDTSGQGRQMPTHWGNARLHIINKSSCTGTQFLHACGTSEAGRFLASLSREGIDHGLPYQEDEIVYVSAGDGTVAQGEFWEALTTAVVDKLPILFLVEDNGHAISVPTSVQTPEGSISKALANFPGLAIAQCDGRCPIHSFATAQEAVKYLRKGTGPLLLHATVTRPYSHSLSDDHSTYRTKEELAQEAQNDVLKTYPQLLMDTGIITENQKKKLYKEVDIEIKEALAKALSTPPPKKEEALDHLFSHQKDIRGDEFNSPPRPEGPEEVSLALGLNSVLKSEFTHNPLLRLFGQDVADFTDQKKLKDPSLKGKGGVFKITAGVQRLTREGQVYNSPLAEANIIGRAIGQAIRGIKPVVEIQFFDYIWTAFMQLKNEMATLRYRSAGDFKCPMVVRVPIGGYLRGGAIYHSQCGESIFTHIPGICVAFPSRALDAMGLLRTAIRADDPVMFLEHKHLYYQGYNRCADPGSEFMIPFGQGRLVKEGQDATVIAWGALVHKAQEGVAKVEEKTGKSIEIIDPRTLVPFDMDLVVTSLRKTGRLLICHEETKTSGFAGEIAAKVNEECFESLDAPIHRVCALDSHIAYCPDLEEHILPGLDNITEALTSLLHY